MRKYVVYTTVARWVSEDGPDDVFVKVSGVEVEIEAFDRSVAWREARIMQKQNGWGDIRLQSLESLNE